MKNKLYEGLVESVPSDLTVTEFIPGISWMAARLSDGSVGIAANMAAAECESPVGKCARSAAADILSEDFTRASAGLAVANAYYNSVSRLDRLRTQVPHEAVCTDGIDISGKTVGMIGHMKRTADRLTEAKTVYIFELDPKAGDLPASEEPRLLPQCDIVIVSGTSITNHTLPGIIEMAEKAQIIMLGPSVPMWEDFPGVSRLCGSAVTKKDEFMAWTGNNAGSPLPFTASYILDVGK